jgi:hypothetical protein
MHVVAPFGNDELHLHAKGDKHNVRTNMRQRESRIISQTRITEA